MSSSFEDSPTSTEESKLEELFQSKLKIGSLKIRGYRRTNPSFLHSLVAPSLGGENFREVIENLSIAIERLRELDIFKGVDVFLDESSVPDQTDVLVTVSEKGRLQLRLGTTVEREGFETGLETCATLRNIFGKAERLRFEAGTEGTDLARGYGVAEFYKPHAFGCDTFFSAYLNRQYFNEKQRSHNEVSRGFVTSFGFPQSLGIFSYEGAWREISVTEPSASSTIREEAGFSFKSSIKHTYEIDSRDNPQAPIEGKCFNVHTELAGLGGSVRYIRQQLESQLHIPIGDTEASYGIACRLGYLYTPKSYLSTVLDRFYLGGPNSFRGFQTRGVGPYEKDDPLGGELFYTIFSSLSIPLPVKGVLGNLFRPKAHIFATIGDISSVKDSQSLLGQVFTRQLPWKNLFETTRISVGLGVVADTQLGRLEVNYCHVLRRTQGDRIHSGIQFGISKTFG
ncbi:sorting and assembly machinery component 50 [Galdieria sulphuraria]|uniref:Sorting and assembly machinery component 50 n=1 Tax=Galdieria sulphuraria TaxID=130081 RepID=M2VY12_GALSU|nr:sorting and assembly machinery component 50 [Galdieria sulphuraria]EME28191.1 sorting and assembly machinery component 50 [Galdieria sulphuraria]|eukprot:XP_005704711.1 sorting and assembly machinery component 50 [Galdieria sulphuraria]